MLQLGCFDPLVSDAQCKAYEDEVARLTMLPLGNVVSGPDRFVRKPAPPGGLGVRDVQALLREAGFFPGGRDDGIFGYRTLSAVRLFQEYVRSVEGQPAMVPDGDVGPKTQAELQRTEEMASVGRLLAGIAHEINNPVNAVLNTAQPLAEALAELQAQPAVDDATWAAQLEELAAMQRVLSRGARRTHEIVQTLRSYTHTESVPPLPVDVVRCLQEALELVSVDQLDLKPALQVTVQVDGQPLILGHFGQLQQLLVNMLSNAVHAVQERCAASRRQPGAALQPPYQPQLQLSVVQTAQTVQVMVSDNGPGIEPALLSRIFDPFFSTKAATQGMGLGLSIAHNLVSRLGGRLDVKSQPGQGATFTVTLPAAPDLTTGFPAETSTASAGPAYKR